jgi:hypothetical protein
VLRELAFAALFGLVGLGTVGFGVERLLRTYQLRSTALDDLTDATAGGRVGLQGRAESAGETLTAPFSDKTCLAFTYEIEKYGRDGDGSNWRRVTGGSAGVPFRLVVDGGEALVRADRDPDLLLDHEQTRFDVGRDEEPPERVRQFVAGDASVGTGLTVEVDLGPVSVELGERRRYTERLLRAGETSFVAGHARSHAAATDVAVPDSVGAVVGPFAHERASNGVLTRLRGRLAGLPFTVSDAPLSETDGSGSLVAGAMMTLIGTVFVGVALLILGATL